MRTGQRPMSVVNYPSMGVALAQGARARADDKLPSYISIAPSRGPAQRRIRTRLPRAEVRAVGGRREQHAGTGAMLAGGQDFAELESRRDQAARRASPPSRPSGGSRLWQMLEEGFLSRHPGARPRPIARSTTMRCR